MAKVKFLEDYKYSVDKVNIIESKKGDIVDIEDGLASRLVTRKICTQSGVFNPVNEVAAIDPVEEVKEVKPKRKRRTKKKAE